MGDGVFDALRGNLAGALRVHPRVAQQAIPGDAAACERLARALPPLVPFKGAYAGVIAVLDWDHLLPSKALALRLHACYDEDSLARSRRAVEARAAEIAAADRFPEFDVPDFAELPADESYVVELSSALAVGEARLVSPWRRSVEPAAAARALGVVRARPELAKAGRPGDGPAGELGAVGWTPPCESGHERWTIDVWHVLAFDGRAGVGRSYLVDLDGGGIVRTRDLALRGG